MKSLFVYRINKIIALQVFIIIIFEIVPLKNRKSSTINLQLSCALIFEKSAI